MQAQEVACARTAIVSSKDSLDSIKEKARASAGFFILPTAVPTAAEAKAYTRSAITIAASIVWPTVTAAVSIVRPRSVAVVPVVRAVVTISIVAVMISIVAIVTTARAEVG